MILLGKIPLSQKFYTSAATDASDKYEVCLVDYSRVDVFIVVCFAFRGFWQSRESQILIGYIVSLHAAPED